MPKKAKNEESISLACRGHSLTHFTGVQNKTLISTVHPWWK
jgi:hypothetical protein